MCVCVWERSSCDPTQDSDNHQTLFSRLQLVPFNAPNLPEKECNWGMPLVLLALQQISCECYCFISLAAWHLAVVLLFISEWMFLCKHCYNPLVMSHMSIKWWQALGNTMQIQYYGLQKNAIFVMLSLWNFYEDCPRKGVDQLAHFDAIFCCAIAMVLKDVKCFQFI